MTPAGQLTILAVDDERTQLEDLARLLRSLPQVREVECAYDGREALARATRHDYDAIFLDVRMPDLDGVALGRVLRRFASPPQLVFVSAYDSAAVEAFELEALDYLRKPVARRRLEEAVSRVAAAVERAEGPSETASGSVSADGGDMIAVPVAHGGTTRLLARGSIDFVQAYGDFVRIVTADGRYLVRGRLSELERRWAGDGFVRVHRQYLANLRNAVELRPLLGGTAELTFGGGAKIPVARRHAAELGRLLGL